MKKHLLIAFALATSAVLTAQTPQTQLNTQTDFSDFAITTNSANPIILAGTTPVSITGTNCATGFFQKQYTAGVVCDSIVATYKIKASPNSTITNYGSAVPPGTSSRRVKLPNATLLNVGFSLQFCGANDTISFSDLVVMAYPKETVGIAKNKSDIAMTIYAADHQIFIKNMNLEGLSVAIYDLSGRQVYTGNASEKMEFNFVQGIYMLTLVDKERNVIAVKKIRQE